MVQEIIFVSGRLCAGKNTYCSTFLPSISEHIIVSDIVRSIVNNNDRYSLQNTADLDVVIASHIVAKAISSSKPFILIDGCRQLSIYRAVPNMIKKHYNGQCEFDLVWLQSPFEVRKRRFLYRAAQKDKGIVFEEAEKRDDKLGLKEFELHALECGCVINN